MCGDELLQLASGLYEEIGSPDSISSGYISGWLVNNLGTLNVLIDTAFSGVDGCIVGISGADITDDELAVYKEVFKVNWYTRAINTSLGAMAYDWSEIEEGDSRIRRVSKNEASKTYLVLRRQSEESLKDLVFSYKYNRAVPASVDNPSTPANVWGVDMNLPALPIRWNV